MLDWTHIREKHELESAYRKILPGLSKIANQCGYALAVHGSMQRDLDLVAVPWVKKAMKAESLVIMLQEHIFGYSYTRAFWKKDAHSDPKPHGRKAYTIHLANLSDEFKGTSFGSQQRHAWIDLSISPVL